jgi:hypothetical protein
MVSKPRGPGFNLGTRIRLFVHPLSINLCCFIIYHYFISYGSIVFIFLFKLSLHICILIHSVCQLIYVIHPLKLTLLLGSMQRGVIS